MSERIRGSYDDALYKSTFTLLYFTLQHNTSVSVNPSWNSGGARHIVNRHRTLTLSVALALHRLICSWYTWLLSLILRGAQTHLQRGPQKLATIFNITHVFHGVFFTFWANGNSKEYSAIKVNNKMAHSAWTRLQQLTNQASFYQFTFSLNSGLIYQWDLRQHLNVTFELFVSSALV